MGSYQPAYVPAPASPSPGWLSRHWKLLLFGGLAAVVVAGALFAGGIMLFVFSIMKSNEPYQTAVAAAQASPELQKDLGTPIEAGWWVGGSVNSTPAAGDADLAIPVHGPKGKATVYVVARKSAGVWDYRRLEAEVESTRMRTNLLPPGHPTPPAGYEDPQ